MVPNRATFIRIYLSRFCLWVLFEPLLSNVLDSGVENAAYIKSDQLIVAKDGVSPPSLYSWTAKTILPTLWFLQYWQLLDFTRNVYKSLLKFKVSIYTKQCFCFKPTPESLFGDVPDFDVYTSINSVYIDQSGRKIDHLGAANLT